MVKTRCFALQGLVTVLIPLMFACSHAREMELWPPIEPYRTGYLKVSDIHELYYELCGNPEGKPVIVLHGGPGGSSSPYMRRFFDPSRFHMVLYDQRGAGKSRPFAETKENTTQYLVEDIERLRNDLGLGKIILFGGSWGTTLALAYAETYPENVAGLLLRGVFTASKAEIDHFYHGGVRTFFPDVYDRLVSALPDPDRRPLPAYLLELTQSGDPESRMKYVRAWAEYEIKISSLSLTDEEVARILKEEDLTAFSTLENYYMANGCFLEEGQLLRDAHKLAQIPTVIVNGRYDVICPPVTAYRLHQLLPQSKLVLAESSGHWMGEPAIQSELLKAAREFE